MAPKPETTPKSVSFCVVKCPTAPGEARVELCTDRYRAADQMEFGEGAVYGCQDTSKTNGDPCPRGFTPVSVSLDALCGLTPVRRRQAEDPDDSPDAFVAFT